MKRSRRMLLTAAIGVTAMGCAANESAPRLAADIAPAARGEDIVAVAAVVPAAVIDEAEMEEVAVDATTAERTLAADQPRFQLFDNRPQRIFMGANAAARIHDRVYVGGGIAYMSATSGSFGAVTLMSLNGPSSRRLIFHPSRGGAGCSCGAAGRQYGHFAAL